MSIRACVVATAVALSVLVCAPIASASLSAKVTVVTSAKGASRIVVTLRSSKALGKRQRPTAVRVVARGRTYKLTRAKSAAASASLGTWRSAAYTGAAGARVKALAGTKVKIRLTTPAGARTLSASVPATPGPGTGTEPVTAPPPSSTTPVTSTPPGPSDGPPFNPPDHDMTGNEAYDHFKGYFADSRFTDCVAGWPNCAYEERYSHFADGTQWYCRLTPSSGSDIKSVGTITQITGAEQKTDGSWGVEYRLSSYGNMTFYSWRVAADGSVTGLYWGPGRDPSSGPADQSLTGLVWARGARDCSY